MRATSECLMRNNLRRTSLVFTSIIAHQHHDWLNLWQLLVIKDYITAVSVAEQDVTDLNCCPPQTLFRGFETVTSC